MSKKSANNYVEKELAKISYHYEQIAKLTRPGGNLERAARILDGDESYVSDLHKNANRMQKHTEEADLAIRGSYTTGEFYESANDKFLRRYINEGNKNRSTTKKKMANRNKFK